MQRIWNSYIHFQVWTEAHGLTCSPALLKQRRKKAWKKHYSEPQLRCQSNWVLVMKWVRDMSTVLYQLGYQANWEPVIKWVRDVSTELYQLSYQANWGLVIEVSSWWPVTGGKRCSMHMKLIYILHCGVNHKSRSDHGKFWALLSSCKRRPEHLCRDRDFEP